MSDSLRTKHKPGVTTVRCGWVSIATLLGAAISLAGCQPSGSSGSSAATFTDAAVGGPMSDDDIVNAYSETKSDDGAPSLPKAPAQLQLKVLSKMKLDRLYDFLHKVSNNSSVNVGGTTVRGVNDMLTLYKPHFLKIQMHFSQVSDFWEFMRFNPTSVTPSEFKQSMRDIATFTTKIGRPALNKQQQPPSGVTPSQNTFKNQGRACVTATPFLLNGCTNLRNQAACNNLTAAMICVVHNMFKAKQPPGEVKGEGFDNIGGNNDFGAGEDSGDGDGGEQ
jgi:hypothetical protein